MLRMPGFSVEVYSSGIKFLENARTAEIGCVILDMHMPGMNGLQVQAAMVARDIRLPLILLTANGDIALVVQAMRAGAVDVLAKPVEKAALLDAVNRAFARIDGTDLGLAEAADASAKVASLTTRERAILDGLARGHPHKAIAEDLGLSSWSMEVHRASLIVKLGVSTFSDTVRIAIAAGMGKSGGALGLR